MRTALLCASIVLAGVSCEQATPPHAAPEQHHSELPAPREPDPRELPAPLPRHGFVVSAGGMGGGETVVVDYDARTFRYIRVPIAYADARGKVDRTFPIAQASVDKLRALAGAAQREEAHGEQPNISDSAELFYAIDGDQHVAISGTMFDASAAGEPAWRPSAGRLLQATFELAKTLGE